jgi:hypothetical protein
MLVAYLKFSHKKEVLPAAVEHISTALSVKHQHRNGVHTYVGEIKVPTPCYEVTGNTFVDRSTPELADIRIETRDGGGVCAQVITVKKFRISFEAKADAIVKGYLNGTPVLLRVTEVTDPKIDLTKLNT